MRKELEAAISFRVRDLGCGLRGTYVGIEGVGSGGPT